MSIRCQSGDLGQGDQPASPPPGVGGEAGDQLISFTRAANVWPSLATSGAEISVGSASSAAAAASALAEPPFTLVDRIGTDPVCAPAPQS
jgi:hypothetical protein